MRIVINLYYNVVIVVVVVYKLVYTKTYPALVVNETMTMTLSLSLRLLNPHSNNQLPECLARMLLVNVAVDEEEGNQEQKEDPLECV